MSLTTDWLVPSLPLSSYLSRLAAPLLVQLPRCQLAQKLDQEPVCDFDTSVENIDDHRINYLRVVRC
jgi:hypothetical protein